MTALVFGRHPGFMVGTSALAAGPAGARVRQLTLDAVQSLKADVSAGSSLVFHDLRTLANEEGIDPDCPGFVLADRFLLALPSHLPSPELAIDSDGDVVFDWAGARGRMFTAALRADGRLTYASRLSTEDKDYGTKQFADAIPRQVLERLFEVVGAGQHS